uniref:Uncharacterized protein n=1 Tax=Trichobilharzia regenti TaxID=157069 RepID=A0AA85IYP1_TRIRE|nr:unnamed protein product [Trichobilharzia regenti]
MKIYCSLYFLLFVVIHVADFNGIAPTENNTSTTDSPVQKTTPRVTSTEVTQQPLVTAEKMKISQSSGKTKDFIRKLKEEKAKTAMRFG